MWKENLPINCPPLNAKEIKTEVFRIIKDEVPTEHDFAPYSKLYPDNPRYNSLCKAYAVSFYDSFQNAKIALEDALDRGNNIGSFIGQYEINENDGINEYKSNTGHYSTWFYKSWDFQKFNPSSIIQINETRP